MEFVSIEEVTAAYFDCRRNKKNKRSAIEYEMDYELNNWRLYRELNDMTYEIGSSYAFCVTRPKLREIFAADFRDRIVHHLIMMRFMPIFEARMIEDSYNCRKGKGTFYGVQRIKKHIEDVSENYTRDAWILKCDLQGFFMSIDKDVLWSMIESCINEDYHGDNKKWWLWLIKKVVMHRPECNCVRKGDLTLWNNLDSDKSLFTSNGKGLPIGNLTSQIFANFYMTHFDLWICSLLDENERYGRYVDDFIIVSRNKRKLLSLLPKIRALLRDELHVKLHPRKIYLQHATKGVEFVGTVIKPHRSYTTNRTINNMLQVLKEWNAEENPDQERYVQRYNSYSGFLVHNNTYGIRYRMYTAIKHKAGIYMSGRMHHLKISNSYKNEIRKKPITEGLLRARNKSRKRVCRPRKRTWGRRYDNLR